MRVAASFALCACQLLAFKMACSQTVRAHKRSVLTNGRPLLYIFHNSWTHMTLQRHDWLSYSTQLDQGTSIQLAIARDFAEPHCHTPAV